jgi:hypothetical protein
MKESTFLLCNQSNDESSKDPNIKCRECSNVMQSQGYQTPQDIPIDGNKAMME